MKFRKVLSLFAAAAMAVSSFTALATTASAAEKTEGFFISNTYTDTSATVANGTELFAGEGFVTMTTYGDAAAVKKDSNSPDEWGDYAIQFRLGKNYTGDVSNDIQSDCAGVIVEPEVDGTCSLYVRRGAGKNVVLSDGKTVTEKVQEGESGNFYEVVDFDMTAGTTYCVYARGGTAYLYGITYTAETDVPIEPEEPKESVAYTWDFTNSEYFASAINAGKTIISDQGETTPIMSNPGAKFSNNNTSVKDAAGNAVLVVKTEATVANAMQLDIPDGASAKLSIQLSSGSTGKAMNIVDTEGNIVLSASDYTKNVLDKTYTCDLECNKTYYLDTTAYKAYIGKVVLTVYPVVEEPGETDEPVEPGETDEPMVPVGPIDVAADFTGEGILTADEVATGTKVDFGINAAGERVAADSADAVMVVDATTHASVHGLIWFKSTITVSGPAMITAGTCAWGADLIVKDADGNEVAKVNTNNGTCFHGDKANNVVVAYYKGEGTTLSIEGGNYLPYIAVKEIDASEIPNDAVVTYDLGTSGATGTAPVAQTVEIGAEATIPANRTLYVEGSTLIGWTDGINTYAPGAAITVTENITLTPVFAANTAAFGDADATVNYSFRQDEGTPVVAYQNNTGFLVYQANIGDAVIDVKMDVDTTSGKLANGSWKDWAQVNSGTKFIVPVVAGSVVTMGDLYSDSGEYTIGGVALVGDGGTYTATAAGTVEIVAGANTGSYWRGFSVTYPKAQEAKIDSLVELIKQYPASEGYEGEATALKATFTITGNTSFNHVAFTVSDKTAEGDVTVVSGDGASAVYGIVVNAIIEADAVTAVASSVE